MRRPLLIAALFAASPLMAQSSPQLPGAQDPSRVTAGSYAVDSGHSMVGFKVNHFGFNAYYGIFGDVRGTMTIDPADLEDTKVDVMIPVASVTTPSAGLTAHLLRAGADGGKPDFFGPAPAEARFVSTRVEVTGTQAIITGDLTLNGVTKRVQLDAEYIGAGVNTYNSRETIGFEAEGEIKRSEFGLGYGIPLVGDDVELDITIAFEKQ